MPTSENLYTDDSDVGALAPEAKEDSGGQTALLPKAICPGMGVGDTITLKIDSVQEDSYVVSYPRQEGPSEAPSARGGDMEEMMG